MRAPRGGRRVSWHRLDGRDQEGSDPEQLRARVAELETALASQESTLEQYRAFLTQGGVAVTWLAHDGRIQMINEVGARNLGGTPQTIIGKTIYELVPPLAEQTRERIALAFSGETKHYESRVELPGGTRWFSSFYYPVRDNSGAVISAQIVAQDLTQLRLAEQALEHSEQTLETAQARAKLGTWEWSPRDGATHWSSEMRRLLNAAADGPPPNVEQILEHIHPEDHARLAALVAANGGTEIGRVIEFRSHPDRGEVRYLSGTIDHREVEDGELTKLSGTVMDVTAHHEVLQQQRELQTQMQHAQKLESLGVLAGGIAHDFNNILLSIMGNAELALFDTPEKSRIRDHVQEILAASHRAAELCMQMLAYSGKGQFIVRATDLSNVVREMTHLIDASISKRAELDSDLAEDLPAVMADATQLGQIVMNLITNASEALADGSGTITVRTGRRYCDAEYLSSSYVDDELPPGEYVFLDVIDTGSGMDRSTRDRMFDPFFSSKATGRGLGLAAVLGIIRGHGGAVHVDTSPGAGTTMTVLLPPCATPVEESLDTGEWETPTPGAGSIMVVDDEAPVRSLTEKALEGAGYLVFTASDGREAVEFFREYQNAIDLVLLDVTMPKMDGRETFAHLEEINPEVKVILMSGYDEQSAVPGLTGSKRADFLQKPFRPSTMLERVQKMLKRRP